MQASSSRSKPHIPSPGSASGSDPGSGSESDYSSSDVTEDEDGQELTPALDAAILRTLRKIKSKDPGVYGSENILQEELKRAQEKAQEKGLQAGTVKKIAAKPYLLADYHRSKLLSSDNANDEDEEQQPEPLPYVQSQRLLREQAVSAFKALASDDDDNEEDDFVPKKRDKDEDEADQDEEEYRQFLLEMGGGEEEVRKVLGMGDAPVTKHTAPDSDAEEEQEEARVLSKVEKEEMIARKAEKKARKAKADDDFLMNYILNRGWIDRTDDHVPTYDEVVGVDKEEEAEKEAESKFKASSSSHPWGLLEEEDEFDEKAEQFETEYNFRFEEPGASTIAAHPRDIPSLVRRPDDVRKTKRARRAERKAAEKAAQEEELKKKKGSKRREMEKRMASLKSDLAAEGVEGEVDWDQLEKVLDGEWDEGEWEKVVGGMLNKVGEADDEDEDGKPIWNDDLGDAEYDDFDQEDDAEGHEMDVDQSYDQMDEDGPINMDADFVDDEPSKKKRKRSKKDKHRAPSPEFDIVPEEAELSVADKAKKVKEAMDEYRALDHEDMIGDLPTKFRYTKALPTSFGLSPVEILLATDEELNKVVGVKSIAPYRKGGIGMAGMGLGKRVRELKDELSKRRWGEENRSRDQGGESSDRMRDNGYADVGGNKRAGKRKGRKERQREAKAGGEDGVSVQATGVEHETPQGKRKAEELGGIASEAGGADGEGKKKRRKRKKGAESEIPT
ncbi:hypothetical protein IAR55_005085 [Kwoniella newhampshirensis]|uniref:Kri1-like C-terminal domain-containing protein n=1 Tax=Kwoniella newhampshirensis TaxID=1651941 RepID=A0AAW0YX67_9TREE